MQDISGVAPFWSFSIESSARRWWTKMQWIAVCSCINSWERPLRCQLTLDAHLIFTTWSTIIRFRKNLWYRYRYIPHFTEEKWLPKVTYSSWGRNTHLGFKLRQPGCGVHALTMSSCARCGYHMSGVFKFVPNFKLEQIFEICSNFTYSPLLSSYTNKISKKAQYLVIYSTYATCLTVRKGGAILSHLHIFV